MISVHLTDNRNSKLIESGEPRMANSVVRAKIEMHMIQFSHFCRAMVKGRAFLIRLIDPNQLIFNELLHISINVETYISTSEVTSLFDCDSKSNRPHVKNE